MIFSRRGRGKSGSIHTFFTPGIERLEDRRLLSAVAGIASLEVINTATQQLVSGGLLVDGATIDLAVTGRQLNITANPTDGTVGSVRFNYDGNPVYRIENFAPYSIAGDTPARGGGAALLPWVPAVGPHTLVVTAYSLAQGNGDRGASDPISFNVIDSSKTPPPTRINAGGSAFVGSTGDLFSADRFFVGGSTSTSKYNVNGTTDDALYQSTRTGRSFSFEESVCPGTYTLTLRFADPTATSRGQRLFDVRANGISLLHNFDIYDQTKAVRTALNRTFTVSIPTGHLSLGFAGDRGNAIVSAVELVAADRAPVIPGSIYIHAGGTAYTDSVGKHFEADNGFVGGRAGTTSSMPDDNSDAELFSTNRHGSTFSFNRAVANGHYELWLEFYDPESIAGQRTFDVAADGTSILSSFDIADHAVDFNVPGDSNVAVTEAFGITVSDGHFNLTFTGKIGEAMVSAIVLIPKDIPTAAAPYSDQAQSDAYRLAKSEWNLHVLGFQILLYSDDHHVRYPVDLAHLYSDLGDWNIQSTASPRSDTLLPRGDLSDNEKLAWAATINDYIYIGAGFRGNEDPNIVVAYENPARVTGDLAVLFLDGHTDVVTREELNTLVPGSTANITPTPVPPIKAAPVDQKIVASANQLLAIGTAIEYFTLDNQLWYPPDLGTVLADETISIDSFVNPRGTTKIPNGLTTDQAVAFVDNSTDYIYLGKGKHGAPSADTVIAYENPADNANGILFLFADGRVEFRETSWALQTIAGASSSFGMN